MVLLLSYSTTRASLARYCSHFILTSTASGMSGFIHAITHPITKPKCWQCMGDEGWLCGESLPLPQHHSPGHPAGLSSWYLKDYHET